MHGTTQGKSDRAFHVTLSDPSGGYTLARDTAIGAILYDIPVDAEIWQIQGTEQTSPLLGKTVLTHGNIVTAVGPAGFNMQTPDSRADADAMTSNGVYVYTGSAPTVAIGDVVDVDAVVDNYYNLTELKNADRHRGVARREAAEGGGVRRQHAVVRPGPPVLRRDQLPVLRRHAGEDPPRHDQHRQQALQRRTVRRGQHHRQRQALAARAGRGLRRAGARRRRRCRTGTATRKCSR